MKNIPTTVNIKPRDKVSYKMTFVYFGEAKRKNREVAGQPEKSQPKM
jgi:hypothetical protein